MLRSELGDSVFWRSIRKYYSRYAGGIADTEDLQKVFEEVSGTKLSAFFQQWLYNPGQPDLAMQWNYNGQSKEVTLKIDQKQAGDFVFPLTIGLKFPSGRFDRQKVYVDKRSKIFTFKTSDKPTSIIADPGIELLINYTIREK
jgi:aminopeptidase N